MNSGSSLQKYAPKAGDYTDKDPWRVVSHLEGLSYVANLLTNPDIDSIAFPLRCLRIRCALDMSDSSLQRLNKIKRFFKALQRNEKVEKLDLAQCQISDHTIREHLSVMLQQNTSIRHLDVSNNAFTDNGAIVLLTSLTSCSIHTLNLADNAITGLTLEQTTSILAQDFLESLDLTRTEVGAQGMKVFAPLLANLKKMKKLSLENVKMGDEGCVLLADSFKSNESVQVLNIAENHIGRIGISALVSQVLDVNHVHISMKKLDISKNFFGDQGFDVIIEKMKENERLEVLKMKKTGITLPKFKIFCRMMNDRFNQSNVSLFPKLRTLGVDNNGLGNFCSELLELLGNEKCTITELGYDSNDVNDFGCKVFRDWMRQQQRKLEKLTLRSSLVTSEGAEFLADVIKCEGKCKQFRELDLRKNTKLGVKGAIWFKKAFRVRQCTWKENLTFKFHILFQDVGVEGVNHLSIGCRELPSWLKENVVVVVKQNGEEKEYVRSSSLQQQWDLALGKEVKYLGVSATAPAPATAETTKRKGEKIHLGEREHELSKFNTKLSLRRVWIYGENDEGEDQWKEIMDATYTSKYICVNDRDNEKWNSSLFGLVKKGFGSAVVGNTLHRFGMLMRLKYYAESEDFIKDLFLTTFSSSSSSAALMKEIESAEVDKLISKLVRKDVQQFHDVLFSQTSLKSEGKTMFEFCLLYSKGPLIDVVRQFLNLSPTNLPFLQQKIAHSGKTYRDLCLESKDKFVKRYAQHKNLVLFRFLEVENMYLSKFVKISKVEDLLLTEEYEDFERFFYMRRIAPSGEQNDEMLANNEYETHLSFCCGRRNEYFDDDDSIVMEDRVENLILKNENMELEKDFVQQISQLSHQKQRLFDDSLMPSFTKMYQTSLREVLDNESFQYGRKLKRVQVIVKMLANSLNHFNDRNWVVGAHKGRHSSLAVKNRIHGNVKPRNILLKNEDEMPDLDAGNNGVLPGKWVLSDFTRSRVHGEEYYPIKDSGYNPPEVAERVLSKDKHNRKRLLANEKMDVWQFGVVLFEILSGTTLFRMEKSNDLIVDERERAELVNWLSLDEERAKLIVSKKKTEKEKMLPTSCWYDDEELFYTEEEKAKVLEQGKELVERCLQRNPVHRPSFNDILLHPFLKNVDIGKQTVVKDAEDVMKVVDVKSSSGWKEASFLRRQPHLHLINTDFEQAKVLVKSIEKRLQQVGCRVTTDSDTEEEEVLRKYVESARVVGCLLTSDVFYRVKVVKQLLFAEDCRMRWDKEDGRVLFFDLNSAVDLTKDNLVFNKNSFANDWIMSDRFQYTIKLLAQQDCSSSFQSFNLNKKNFDSIEKCWEVFLVQVFKPLVASYLQDPIKYCATSFLQQPLLDRVLLDGHLTPTKDLVSFPVCSMPKVFKDSHDVLNKKLEERKENKKFMGLYFLPSEKEKQGSIKTYVLCNSDFVAGSESRNAVDAIARSLEVPNVLNKCEEEHKEETDPENRLFNKVKTTFNLKKDSHLKSTLSKRKNWLMNVKDLVKNIKRKEATLLVVLYVQKGIFKKYSTFLHEAVQQEDQDFQFVLVKGVGCNLKEKELLDEIKEYVPKEMRDRVLNKEEYVPYFKFGSFWQYEGFMDEVVRRARYKIHNPTPRTEFEA